MCLRVYDRNIHCTFAIAYSHCMHTDLKQYRQSINLWLMPLKFGEGLTFDAFISSQRVKSWAFGSGRDQPRIHRCSLVLQVQQNWEFTDFERCPFRGRCWSQSSVKRVSLWTSVFRAARKWALATAIFHPGHSSCQHFSKFHKKNVAALSCY